MTAMADQIHIARPDTEDFSEHEEKLQAWAKSLDTTPERLKEVLRGDPESASQVRNLLGIR